jgi:hypothetical protein
MNFNGKLSDVREMDFNVALDVVYEAALACSAPTARLYRNATLDPQTGRFNSALEAQLALLILD